MSKKGISIIHSKICLSLLGLVVVLIVSCKPATQQNADHPDLTEKIIAHVNMLLSASKTNAALEYLESSYREIAQPGQGDLWAKYNLLNNFYLNYIIDTTRAQSYSDSMRIMLAGHENEYRMEYARTFFAEGDVLMAQKKYAEAFVKFYDGRIYAQKNLDTCNLALFTNQLALVRYRQAQLREAVSYLKQALTETSRCTDTRNLENYFSMPQQIMNTLALCYEQLNLLDSSVIYYRQALDFIAKREKFFPSQKVAIERARGVVNGNLGGVYKKLNNYELANHYLLESIRINDREGYEPTDAKTAQIKLADLYTSTGRFAEARKVIDQLEVNLKRIEDKRRERDLLWLNWYKVKWLYFDRSKQIDSAYQYQRIYYTFSDSLQKADRDLRKADMEGVFKNTEQEYKLDLMDRDGRLKTLYLGAIIIFTLMTLVILRMLWLNLKRARETNQQIREQNLQMHRALSALEQSHEDNTRMMRIVAHDLRNPIGAIKMAATLITKKVSETGDDQKMLEIITRSADNALALVTELLQAQAQAGDLKREPVEMAAMLQYCADLLVHKASQKQQKIKLATTPVTLNVSREKLWRVASNLIANAIKFSPESSIIVVGLEKRPDNILISVSDDGIGIPPEMESKIFDMFTDAKREGTNGEQPFGMGLAISKQIVEAHGGSIWFIRKPHKGTTFFVELPIV